jgi:hypothetical protein
MILIRKAKTKKEKPEYLAISSINFESTHKDDDEVKDSPETGEVSPEAERGPLEQHLDDKQDAEGEVGPVENRLEQRVVVEVDVLEAQGDARGENHHQDDPLESGRVDHLEHTLAHEKPALANV